MLIKTFSSSLSKICIPRIFTAEDSNSLHKDQRRINSSGSMKSNSNSKTIIINYYTLYKAIIIRGYNYNYHLLSVKIYKLKSNQNSLAIFILHQPSLLNCGKDFRRNNLLSKIKKNHI